MADRELRLLSLDGGGVRGLSSLYILRSLMEKVQPDAKDIPKPCDYFDMIGGTSTGGLIAIMLGRLEMSVDQCIAAYTSLSEEIFAKESKSWTRFSFKGDLKSRFDAKRLEKAIIKILHQSGMDEGTLLSSPNSKCKVYVLVPIGEAIFVCAANQKNETVVLRSYHSPRDNRRLNYVKIWEACRATSAAQGFFNPIAIPPGKGSELFTDGGIRANNPVKELWAQACDLWATDGSEPQETQLRAKLRCLVSVGTGRPDLTNYSTSLKGVVKVLTKIATDTEAVAESFARDKPELFDESQYFRFNVDRGLKGIGLDECDRLSEITAATGSYIERQAVFLSLQKCAGQIAKGQLQIPIRSRDSTDRPARQDHQNVFLPPPTLPATADRSSPFHIPFKLDGVVHADQFVPRPEYTTLIEEVLLQDAAQKMRIYVLHGMGGIGKTQLAIDFAYKHKARFTSVFWLQGQNEDALRQSLVKSAKRIPRGQISDESRRARPANAGEQQDIIDEVMDWLSQEGNHNWLLIFDNIDLDPANADDRDRGAYRVNDYLPGDQGSVLITSRLASLAQIGSGRSDEELSTVTHELSKDIFERWYGKGVEDDEHLQSLLGPKRLSGLPLAIAQSAVYFKQNQPMRISEYIRHFDTMWPQVMGSGDERPLYNYHAAVGVTWALSMQQVREQNEIAERLVQVWALIDNQGFGFELFQDLPEDLPWDSDSEEEDSEYSNELPAWLITLSANEASFQQCLQLLQRYRLASRDVSKRLDNTEPRTPRYAMHPLVHRWAGQMQTSDQRCAAARAAVWLFSVCGNTRHHLFRDGIVLAYFKPHVHKYLHCVFQDEEIKSALLSSTPSITALRDIASYQELEENLAVRIYRLVLDSADGHLKLPLTLRLVILVGLGKALEDEDPEKAAALVPMLGDQAQGLIGRKVDSAEEFDVSAWASLQLARFTRHIDPQRAETLLQDLLHTLPESNSQAADVMLELARFLVGRKRVSLAMSRAREALNLIEKYHSEDILLHYEGQSTLVRINLIQLTLHSLLPDHLLLEDTRTMANEALQSSIAIHATVGHETNQARLRLALLDILAGDFEKADSMLQSVLEFSRLTEDDTLLERVTLYATLMSYCLSKQGVHQTKLGKAQQLEIDGSDIDWDSISTLAQTVPVDLELAGDETIEVDKFWALVLWDRTI